MKTIGERSLASLIRFVLGVAWWLGVVTIVLLAGALVLGLVAKPEDNNLTMSLPVNLELTAPVHGSGASMPNDARIDNVSGSLVFPVRDRGFFAATMLLILVVLGFGLWVVARLRDIFRSLSRGLVFIPENGRRIRWVGLAVIAGELAKAALVYFWSYYTSLHFTANGMRFVATTGFSATTIVAGFCIIIIAEVFREGTRLREEQSLTI